MAVPDLAVVTYLWSSRGKHGGGHRYGPDDVRLLQAQVARNLILPHQFVVVTDRPEAFADDAAIRAVPIDWRKHVSGTCFVRLMTFSPEARSLLGRRVLQLDLDTVVTGNIDHIVSREENLVLWRNPRRWGLTFPDVGYAANLAWFNGSVLLHRTGTMAWLWEDFDPAGPLPRGEQWYLSEAVGRDCPYWDASHGIYRYAPPHRRYGVCGELPENACIVTFPGDAGKPWRAETVAAHPWIAEYRA